MKSCLVNTGTLSNNNFYYLQSASNISNELNIILVYEVDNWILQYRIFFVLKQSFQ